jgi:hypothetical protein
MQLIHTYVLSLQPPVQISLDVQAVRTEEKRTAAREIEALRSYYMEREKQTSDDLLEIEKLHADRYRCCCSCTISMSIVLFLVYCVSCVCTRSFSLICGLKYAHYISLCRLQRLESQLAASKKRLVAAEDNLSVAMREITMEAQVKDSEASLLCCLH